MAIEPDIPYFVSVRAPGSGLPATPAPPQPGPFVPPPAHVLPPPLPRPASTFCSNCGQPVAGIPFCPQCGAPGPSAPPMQYAGPCAPGFAPPFPPSFTPPQTLPSSPAFIPGVSFSDLVPLRAWWQSGAWRQGWLGVFLGCALTPFLLLQATGNDTDVRHAAWGFTIYFAVIWLIAIRALVRPERLSAALLAVVVGMTAVIGVSVAITIERHLAADTSTLAHSIITVGFPEEIAKALPLLLVLLTMRGRIGPRTYLYLGAVSGLTFGAVESVAYTALYSNGIERTGDSSFVTGIIWRLLTDSLFHGAMAGIVGVFVGFAAIAGRQRVLLIVMGLTFAAALHGTYDRTAGHWTGVLVAAVVMFVFAGYIKTSDDIMRLGQPAATSALQPPSAWYPPAPPGPQWGPPHR